jgi:4-hydroxy-tetrahydrodipicolinate synthase
MIGPETLTARLIAAVPLPLDAVGEVHPEGLRRLISTMAASPVDGVAVDTLLGRGTRLAPERRAGLLARWREGLGEARLMIALAGAPPEVRRPLEVFEAAVAMAQQAQRLGADILLVDPPGAIRGRPDRDRLILEYHSEVAQAGLPMLISYRREASGGIDYGPEVLAQLLARPEVLGVLIATLDGIAAFQQVEALARELAPTKRVVSGEERFLGYSLMCGADAALVGMGCASPSRVRDLIDAHFSNDAVRFLKRSGEVDRLARAIFTSPIEGVGLRLLWSLVQGESLPFEAAYDPWTLRPTLAQFDRLVESLIRLDHGELA